MNAQCNINRVQRCSDCDLVCWTQEVFPRLCIVEVVITRVFFDQSLHTNQHYNHLDNRVQRFIIAFPPQLPSTLCGRTASPADLESVHSTFMNNGRSLHRHNTKSTQPRVFEVQWFAFESQCVSVDPICWLWSSCRPAGPGRLGCDSMVWCTGNIDWDVDKDGTAINTSHWSHDRQRGQE